MADDFDKSIGDEATLAGKAKRRSAPEQSLGDERTIDGGDAAGVDTVMDDVEVVDLESRYKIESTLGQGGMGAVFLATDTRLGRKVAVKRILGEAARSKTAVSRFLTEAKAIAALNHPNVVQIYDYGRAADGPFLIMEYVDGNSLLERCRDGALPLDLAVDLACQLCDGLAKAHDLGIVHRDIKPANVLLTKDGLPKLTDFGLAKAEAADHQMTMTGAVLGTPDFMPPEQRKDAALVDHRSDLWSLAATVYQMVTGRSPKIIRFDLLPSGLTSVLGKALEESKDERYQSAREFRDALKTSLAAALPVPAELGEGQCPACGVKNDSSRRFCRGCGGSLEALCLSCSKPMPMWEQICGQCGTKQAPLLDERRGEMAALQAQAEGLLKDYDFDNAEQITVALRDESDPRLKQLVPWATAFVEKISWARDAQLAQVGERLVEALKHEASFDYPSAAHALEQVPEILRSLPLGGQSETVGAVLARVAAKQAEVERLEAFVKARIAAKEFAGLLPEVRKLQGLRPDRTDVEKVGAQLEERQKKLIGHRDEALKLAQSHLDAKDYESVIAVLRKVDRSVETPGVARLRDAANVNIKYLQELMQEISQAVSLKQLDGLMSKVQTAISLRPGHPELLKLLDSLQARDEKIAAGVKDIVSQADEAFKACRFDKAVTLLHRIPEGRRSSEVTDLLDRCECLAMTKAGVISGFEGLPSNLDLADADGVDLSGLATRGRNYLGQIATQGLVDQGIEQWCVRCEAAAEKREAAEEAKRRSNASLRRFLVVGCLALAAIGLLAVGFKLRSFWRTSIIDAALTRGDWREALALDSENVAALVGLAKSKLHAQPPDIEGAFAELKKAERQPGAKAIVQPAIAGAHAVRALAEAKAGRLDRAEKDLQEAIHGGADQTSLAPAHDEMAKAWLARAEQAAEAENGSAIRTAVNAALAHGGDQPQLLAVWRIYATRLITTLDVKGLEFVCAEAKKVGLTKASEAELWIRLGEAALTPLHEDVAIVQRAVDAAQAAGASVAVVAPLRAKGLILKAIAAHAIGDSQAAVEGLVEASQQDAAIVRVTLMNPKYMALRLAVVANYRERFDAAVSGKDKDWGTALQIAAKAEALDNLAEGWVRTTAASLPINELEALPPSIVLRLPSETVLRLPPIRNSIGIELKLLPPGSFFMQRVNDDTRENPREATLTTPFYLGIYEVTNAQWKRVMGYLPSEWKGDDQPVEHVSWEDAIEFCKKLSSFPEEQNARRVYRLPTEAEWEYACRAGTKTKYSFGDDESQLTDYAWINVNAGGQTRPVGKKKPNAWAFYDMHGNVREWCSDSQQAPVAGSLMPVRGGCLRSGGWSCESGYSDRAEPHRNCSLGFRLALSPTVTEPSKAR